MGTIALVVCGMQLRSFGDALVVTRAMTASTIAEIYVDSQQIRVELEIGAADQRVFANLLPDELYTERVGADRPLKERLSVFLKQQWVIEADGRPLEGTVDNIETTKRVVRDEITGDPVPNQPVDAEIVVRVKLNYALDQQPKTIAIAPPDTGEGGADLATIGFVAYHKGVAINDFRYLSRRETLQLDWTDPWYSTFDRRTLRRQYYAPAAAFLYVENLEVRKEIVFRPKDLQEWVDLGLVGAETIKASAREAICQKAASFLDQHTPVLIDGQSYEGTLDRVHFINRSLRTTGVVPDNQDIDINNAMLGAIYVYPIESLPSEVSLNWDLFSDRINQVPGVATDEAGGMPGTLTIDEPTLMWRNYLKHPTVPAFLNIAPPQTKILSLPVLSIACLSAGLLVWMRSSSMTHRAGWTLTLAAIGLISLPIQNARWKIPLTTHAEVSPDDAAQISYSLLHNIYRAFDYRDEGTVYDVLERSIAGELLTQVYLETRQSLTLATQGGAKVKVKQVALIDCQSEQRDQDSFVANCRWIVSGNVGHWGHVHQRTNQYQGKLLVLPIDGRWKITAMDVLSEERL